MKKKDDELTLDFSRIKKIFKSDSNHEDPKKPADEEITLDIKGVLNFIYKYRIVLILLIPFLISGFLRIQPAYLPATDQWAESSVQNYYTNMIAQQVNQKYPNLPAENKNILINTELQKLISEQGAIYNQQVEQTSNQFKEHFKDESGQTYLIAIDPYVFYRQARNLVEHGIIGDKIVNGKVWDDHTVAPIGRASNPTLHPYVIFYNYKIMRIFNRNITLMGAAFYVPMIICMLSVIPAFFIVRRIAGDFGGFFAALIVAIHPNFLTRTVAGFSDTDAYNVFFPLLILWLFLEAFITKDNKKRIALAGAAGFFVGLYSFAWSGWWYIFDFILYTMVGYLIYLSIMEYISNKKEFTKFFKTDDFKIPVIVSAAFLVSSALFVSLMEGWNTFINGPMGPLVLVTLKQATHSTLWPNVYTTVAELNEAAISSIIGAIGGKFLLWLSLIGITLTFIKLKNKLLFIIGSSIWFLLILMFQSSFQSPFVFSTVLGLPVVAAVLLSFYEKNGIDIKLGIILSMWTFGSIFASTKGIRFVLILVPAFAIGLGIAVGFIYKHLTELAIKELNINKNVVKVVFIILLMLLVGISPVPMFCKHGMCKSAFVTATNEVPSMNDAWYSALTKIKDNSEEDAIINSWWDFGHWFKAIADRPVTFDGGSQNRPQAHWIGKVLLTNDEDLAIGILRMLDCGGNTAFDTLNNETNDAIISVDILYSIVKLDEEEAMEILESYVDEATAKRILKQMHCDPPEDFFITSEDMVGKAGVWAHFGSWDFRRAKMWRDARKMSEAEGVKFIKTEFNYSDSAATQIYYDIQAITDEREANNWISPWPSYVASANCQKISNNSLKCVNGVQGQAIPVIIDLNTFEAYIDSPEKQKVQSISYMKDGEFKVKKFNGAEFPYSITLTNKTGTYQTIMMFPELVDSMFTRLFYHEDSTLKHFDFFDHKTDISGLDIFVWKIDWEGTMEEDSTEDEAAVEDTDTAESDDTKGETEDDEESSVVVIKPSNEEEEDTTETDATNET